MALQEELEKEGNWLFRYRSYLPVVLLVAGMLVETFTVRKGVVHLACYESLCLVVSMLGIVVRIMTVGHTPSGTSGRNTERQVAETLNTTGVYSMVRHPLYIGNFLIYLGISMLTFSVGFIVVFVLLFWLYYERIMFAEEQFLRRKFGDVYVRWASVTPAFVPAFRRYSPAAHSFSWKKVVKKEKNGVFALFLIFCIFDIIIRYIGGRHNLNVFLVSMAAITGVAYVSLKWLRRHTGVLDEVGR